MNPDRRKRRKTRPGIVTGGTIKPTVKYIVECKIRGVLLLFGVGVRLFFNTKDGIFQTPKRENCDSVRRKRANRCKTGRSDLIESGILITAGTGKLS